MRYKNPEKVHFYFNLLKIFFTKSHMGARSHITQRKKKTEKITPSSPLIIIVTFLQPPPSYNVTPYKYRHKE